MSARTLISHLSPAERGVLAEFARATRALLGADLEAIRLLDPALAAKGTRNRISTWR